MAVKVAFVDKKGRDECGEVEFIYLKPHKLKDRTIGYLSRCSKIERRLMMLGLILMD